MAHMLAFERALTQALVAHGRIDAQAATDAQAALSAYRADMASLRAGTARDGVVVPALVRQLRSATGFPDAIHTGSTSQDVIDTTLSLTLKRVSEVLAARLLQIVADLDELEDRHSGRQMMGRTRMQAALPIPVGHRVSAWRAPLVRARAQLDQIAEDATPLSLGGPVGTGAGFGDARSAIAADMAAALGLRDPGTSWHTDRSGVVAYGDFLSRISGALGKIGQDVALMSQQGIAEIKLSGRGASSAMAHKQNPVLAELLVTLARFNAAQVAGLHGVLVHEQERSGSAWALEWMIIPQMILTTGRGLTATSDLLGQIKDIAG